MKRLGAIPLTTTALLLALCQTSVTGQTHPLADFDRYIEDARQAWEIPGVAVAVVHNDSVVFAGGFGIRELGRTDRVDERTLFAVGSTSKAFTVAALAMLADEGKVTWDDRATDHLQGFQLSDPYVTRETTVRDLLTHRTGLPGEEVLWFGSGLSRDEILHRVRYLEPSAGLRSAFQYQNIMFLAAGEVVEELSGMTWDDFVRRRIFVPLGMTASNTSVRDLSSQENVASPHARIDGEIVPVNWRNIDNMAAAGSINSSVLDMAQWIRLNLGEGTYEGRSLISPEQMTEIFTPQMVIRREGLWLMWTPEAHLLDYGLGWFLADHQGRLLAMHGGNIDGMSAMVGLMPEEELGVVVLTNMNQTGLMAALAYQAVDLMLGREDMDWSARLLPAFKEGENQASESLAELEASRIAGTAPSLGLEAYAGTYVHSMYGEAKVTMESGGLVLRWGEAFDGRLEHWHYNTYRARWDDAMMEVGFGPALVTFNLDRNGKVSSMEFPQAGEFRRKEEGQ